MTRLRARLQGEPGLPVVELCQAAIIFAASALRDAYTERDRPLIDSTPASGLVTIAVTPLDEDWNTDLPSIPTLMDLCVASDRAASRCPA